MVPAQDVITKLMITPVSRTAGHTQVGFIDCLGARYLTIHSSVSDIATVGTASATGGSISIGEADDTNVSNATTIVADVTALKYARCRSDLIDLRGKKRYIHVTVTAGTAGVSNETQLFSVTGHLSRLEAGPSAEGGRVQGLTNSTSRSTT